MNLPIVFRAAILAVLLPPLGGCATHSSTDDGGRDPAGDAGQTRRLSQIVESEESGLDRLPVSERDRAIEQARQYVEFRTSRKLSYAKKKAMAQACLENGEDNLFCEYMTLDGRPRRRSKNSKGTRYPISLATLKRDLAKHTVELPETLQLRDVGRAVKSVTKMDRLDPFFEALVNYPTCLPPALFTGFAIKAEEGFPEDKYRKYALSLYAKGAECGDNESAIQASYRLGLLYVWEQRYVDADKALVRVIDHPDGELLQSRALYWRQVAAKQLGNRTVEDEMKARLLREYPLSIHGLLAGADTDALEEFEIMTGTDPWVQFRSVTRPDLNPIVTAGEALHRLGFANLSDRILEPLIEQMEGAEPAFQLYVAVLFKRNGDTIRKFQLLAQIFRNDPKMISKQTLEMLYPLSVFELVKIHEEKIDPYVVISLIRQESAFNERAQSPAGAMGLMQLMPRTAKMVGRVQRKQLYDPKINVKVGVAFFSRLLNRFNGDVELALAAYNCGPERVDRWIKRYPIENRMLFLDMLPIRETREYVASIARNYYWYLRLYQKGTLQERLTGSAPTGSRPAHSFHLFGSKS